MKRLQSNTQSNQIVRRVVQHRDNSQINAVNKINSLSGVSMQPTKIVRCPIPQSSQQYINHKMCFICDENIVGQASIITETETATTREKITKKIAKMVGDSFCVIVSEDDVICRRCLALFNSMDKYEYDLETVRSRLRGFVNKKYGIDDDEPPLKVQRLSATESSVRSASESFKMRNESSSISVNNSPQKKGPVKLYKCIACDFKTTDLNAFQPHSNVCKGQNQNRTPQQQQQSSYSPKSVSPANRPVQSVGNRLQKVGETTITRNITQTRVQQRTPLQNQAGRNVHKIRPYKCKMCLERFETRDSAQIHARIHTSQLKSNQEKRLNVLNSSHQNRATSQKPLQEIIKEALSDQDDQDGDVLEFHSCTLCSLTFVNKKLFIQHMKTHENSTDKNSDKNQSYNKSQDTLGDLESIFEKMHSENSHTTSTNGDKNVMVTTQEGGITYNITIPQDEDMKDEKARIDMPSLSSQDNEEAHVSMPSLHDEDRSQEEKELQGEEVPMDLEEMPGNEEGQQLKFIVDENGQFLQLDNHILTTDADGNQILVGVDGNQVLVQLQGGDESLDAEGAIQMALGGNADGQGLILVQGPDGESQLIDASMLQQTEDGNLVLQQDIDGQTHLISTNGQVSFAEGHHVLSVPEGEEGQQQVFIQSMENDGESQEEGESENLKESTETAEESQEESKDETSENVEEKSQEGENTEEQKEVEQTAEETGMEQSEAPAVEEETPKIEESEETKNEEVEGENKDE